jgi:hypothetical protein
MRAEIPSIVMRADAYWFSFLQETKARNWVVCKNSGTLNLHRSTAQLVSSVLSLT